MVYKLEENLSILSKRYQKSIISFYLSQSMETRVCKCSSFEDIYRAESDANRIKEIKVRLNSNLDGLFI
jgi:hypothetical protein